MLEVSAGQSPGRMSFLFYAPIHEIRAILPREEEEEEPA
jgi:hypothetical protein